MTNAKLLMSEYNDLKQHTWGQSKLNQLSLKLDQELADVKGTLMEVSGIVLPAAFIVSGVSSCTAILKKELLK